MICISCEKDFSILNQDIDFYKKLNLPPPLHCPECRELKRMSWCNEGTLYYSTCRLCQKKVLSQFSPNSPRIAYCRNCWWSEKWDPKTYGVDISLDTPIFAQIKELLERIPHCHTHTDLSSENSDFTHHAGHQKNCYMTFHCSFAEDCYYGYGIKKSTNCVDCHYCHESELCYECIDVQNCYDLKWCQECKNCNSSSFLYDCIGCNNCFLSTGLRNKQYFLLNQKLSKEEYFRQIQKFDLGNFEFLQKPLNQFSKIKEKHLRKNLQMFMTENTIGNNVYNAKDSYYCFDSSDIENCSYCSQIQFGAKHCYDIYQFGINIERCYDCSMIGYNIYDCYFCYDLLEQCYNLKYCLSCHSCSNCFGCFGLKKTEYCIFNKQYSKEDYSKLVKRIIDKMLEDGTYGSFFPISLSPHAYNETTAFEWYPKSKNEVISLGLNWQDNLPFTRGMANTKNLPKCVQQIEEDITKKILCCELCHRDYIITYREYLFYKKNNIAIPRSCFNCRRSRRRSLRDSRRIVIRNCHNCDISLPTTLVRPREILCEKCFQKNS